MAGHNELGKEGESMAADWLASQGYRILHRNWRHSYHEIDIIAEKDNSLHFVEVKARTESPLGHPEDSVTRKKFKHLQRVADEYLQQHPGHPWIQFDILAIIFKKDGETEYFLIRDVYL